MSSAQDEKMNVKRGGGGGGGGSGGAKQPHVGEDEIADLVGQLEKYAELKTGQGKRGEGFGGSNNVNKASAGGKKVGTTCAITILLGAWAKKKKKKKRNSVQCVPNYGVISPTRCLTRTPTSPLVS